MTRAAAIALLCGACHSELPPPLELRVDLDTGSQPQPISILDAGVHVPTTAPAPAPASSPVIAGCTRGPCTWVDGEGVFHLAQSPAEVPAAFVERARPLSEPPVQVEGGAVRSEKRPARTATRVSAPEPREEPEDSDRRELPGGWVPVSEYEKKTRRVVFEQTLELHEGFVVPMLRAHETDDPRALSLKEGPPAGASCNTVFDPEKGEHVLACRPP